MKSLLQAITDRVTTKKGMWITLILWLVATIALSIFAPMANEYKVTNVDSLPDDAKSVLAQAKIDKYFKEQEGIPAILVFQAKDEEIGLPELASVLEKIEKAKVPGVEKIVPLGKMPPQAAVQFFSEDKTTAMIPLIYNASMESKEL
ncbi:MAG: MMPL family transporter, partial [Bacillales bacterium]